MDPTTRIDRRSFHAAAAALPFVRWSGGSEPRLLLIDIDDVGFDLLEATPTPNLDRLTLYTQHRSCVPVCSGFRAALQTGVHPSHPNNGIGSIIRHDSSHHLPLTDRLLPRLVPLAEKYGKWHLAGSSYAGHAVDCGYERFAGTSSNLGAQGALYGYYQWWHTEDDGAGAPQVATRQGYATLYYAQRAIARIGSAPFLSLSFHAPHQPFQDPPPWMHTLGTLGSDYDRARAMLQAADLCIGRLVERARAEDCQVVVVSDNGSVQSFGGGKGTLLDAGIRTPLWMLHPAAPSDALVSTLDLYRYVLDHFGAPVPPGCAGLPLGTREYSHAEKFPENGQPHLERARCIVGHGHKLIVEADGTQRFHALPDEETWLPLAGELYERLRARLL